jgi:predicted aspartyl protease
MIGVVKATREAVVPLRLFGSSGTHIDVEAILDTGFTESLTLPESLILALALPRVNTDTVILADGTLVGVYLYAGTVEWDGQTQAVIVHCMEGSPLIGMSLLWDQLLTMQAADGGVVTIGPIP